jgi:predicted metal-dependent phosphoesterase TrpH
VQKAAALGLAAVAITDHDCVDGLEEADQAGKNFGIEVVRGCEVSVRDAYGELHILGLWLPADLAPLERILENIRAIRAQRNKQIVAKLNALGVGITYADVLAEAKGTAIGRPHLAGAIVRGGYSKSGQEAFARYLGSDAPAYVPKETLAPRAAIEVLASIGATVALAHPMLARCTKEVLETRIEEMRVYGLDTLEVYHADHSAADERYLVDLAKRMNMGITGGSDYHGNAKPLVALGRGRGSMRVTTAVLDALKDRRHKQDYVV